MERECSECGNTVCVEIYEGGPDFCLFCALKAHARVTRERDALVDLLRRIRVTQCLLSHAVSNELRLEVYAAVTQKGDGS